MSRFKSKQQNAYPVYLLISGASSFFYALVFTVNVVYHATTVGLDPLQLVLVGTVLEIAYMAFEIPTGIVADIYSRRLSVIVGFAVVGTGFVIEGTFPTFGGVLLAQVVWGIGATFLSGATEAWITDEIGTDQVGAAFLRGSQVGSAMGLLGIVVSVALASIVITLPIILGGALFLALALILAVIMPETGFTPTPRKERDSWRSLFATFRDGVKLIRLRPVLVTILLVSLVFGAYTEGFDRLWRPHILEAFSLPQIAAFDPIVWFGIISAVSTVLSIAATEIVRRRLDLKNTQRLIWALILLYGGMGVASMVFALAGPFWLALGAFWVMQVLRTTSGPIFDTWINQQIDSRVRATVISMAGQSNALGQIMLGPAVGAVGRSFGLRAALSLSGLVLIGVLPLLRRGQSQTITPPSGESTP